MRWVMSVAAVCRAMKARTLAASTQPQPTSARGLAFGVGEEEVFGEGGGGVEGAFDLGEVVAVSGAERGGDGEEGFAGVAAGAGLSLLPQVATRSSSAAIWGR